GMREGLDGVPNHVTSVRADLDRPVEEAAGRPFQLRAMTFRQMLRHSRMRAFAVGTLMDGDAFAAVKTFESCGCQADFDFARDELMRHAVVVAVHFNMRVDVYATFLPDRVLIRDFR